MSDDEREWTIAVRLLEATGPDFALQPLAFLSSLR